MTFDKPNNRAAIPCWLYSNRLGMRAVIHRTAKPRPPLPTHCTRPFPVKILIWNSCATLHNLYESTTALYNYHILGSDAHIAISTNHTPHKFPGPVLPRQAQHM